jgi:hypothetical protein
MGSVDWSILEPRQTAAPRRPMRFGNNQGGWQSWRNFITLCFFVTRYPPPGGILRGSSIDDHFICISLGSGHCENSLSRCSFPSASDESFSTLYFHFRNLRLSHDAVAGGPFSRRCAFSGLGVGDPPELSPHVDSNSQGVDVIRGAVAQFF